MALTPEQMQAIARSVKTDLDAGRQVTPPKPQPEPADAAQSRVAADLVPAATISEPPNADQAQDGAGH